MLLTTLGDVAPSILAIARFTLRTRLSKAANVADRHGAAAALEQFLVKATLLEPGTAEIELAASLEEQAIASGHEFDAGESQLVAMLLTRGAALLITGDKRAIAALAAIVPQEVEGRVACLEQLLATLLDIHPLAEMRNGVCAEPKVDKAVTACMACSTNPEGADVLAGLSSYINDLRKRVGTILAPCEALLPVVS